VPAPAILIVDDDASFRGAAAITLSDAGYRVFAAETPADAEVWLRRESCALVIADIEMEGNRKLEWLASAAAAHPRIPFVLCTGYPNLEGAMDAVRTPARAYLVKPIRGAELTREVARLLAAVAPRSDAVARRLATEWGLTTRETEVFGELARGAANKEIAATIDCSLRTVELHVSVILRKSRTSSRAALLAHLALQASAG